MRVDIRTIAAFFQDIGWRFELMDESSLATRYRCPIPGHYYTLIIEVTVSPYWVYLRALMQRDVDAAQRESVMHLVSHWNARSHQVKFIMLDDCVLLQAEAPVAQWHFGTFRDLLYAVCRFGTATGAEIALLSTDTSVSALYEQVRLAMESRWVPTVPTSDHEFDFDLSFNVIPD